MFKISGRELSNRDAFPHRKDRWRCVTRRQLTRAGYAMSNECCGSRLHGPFDAGHAQEASRSEVSFDPAGYRSEIAMRATCGVRKHA